MAANGLAVCAVRIINNKNFNRMENINEQFKRLFCELDLTDDQAAMIKKLQRDVDAALRQPSVIGSFASEAALERLIKKWYSDAAKIETLTTPNNSKHQRQVANHFLIQLYKCIGDAEVELKNCR